MRIPFFGKKKQAEMAIDPICKMEVDTSNPPGGTSEYEGRVFYFCAPGCKVEFDKAPAQYASA